MMPIPRFILGASSPRILTNLCNLCLHFLRRRWRGDVSCASRLQQIIWLSSRQRTQPSKRPKQLRASERAACVSGPERHAWPSKRELAAASNSLTLAIVVEAGPGNPSDKLRSGNLGAGSPGITSWYSHCSLVTTLPQKKKKKKSI